MALQIITPEHEKKMMALYADREFDVSNYRQIECKDVNGILTEMKYYDSNAEIILTCPYTYQQPIIVKIQNDNYAVFTINRGGGSDVVKDFQLPRLSYDAQVYVTTNNTVIYSDLLPASSSNETHTFFTTWFPSMLIPYQETKLYVRLMNAENVNTTFTLKSLIGMFMTDRRTTISNLGYATANTFRGRDDSPISSTLDLSFVCNLLLSVAGIRDYKLERKSSESRDSPLTSQTSTGIHVSPYKCIIYEGWNVMGSNAVRQNYRLVDEFIDRKLVDSSGVEFRQSRNVSVSANIPDASSTSDMPDIKSDPEPQNSSDDVIKLERVVPDKNFHKDSQQSGGHVDRSNRKQGINKDFYVILNQFGGHAHRYVRITSDTPCRWSLSVNGTIYAQNEIPAGSYTLHNSAIIHSSYSEHRLLIQGGSNVVVNWSVLTLAEDPNKFTGTIVYPEFPVMLTKDGTTGFRRYPFSLARTSRC